MLQNVEDHRRFGTIRNNTALKLNLGIIALSLCFGTIRNNTALKQRNVPFASVTGFGTIRNNTALKRAFYEYFGMC